jgi:hypothetical protein
LVAALAKRTLLASSSASLRSSAVRSGARLNINKLVYHRLKGLGLTSLPGTSALLSAVPPGLVAVATRLHGAPPARAALGVVVVRPTAVLSGADLHPRPTPPGGRNHNVGQDRAEQQVAATGFERYRGDQGSLQPRPAYDLGRDALLLGEVDYGLLGGIGYLRVGAGSTV